MHSGGSLKLGACFGVKNVVHKRSPVYGNYHSEFVPLNRFYFLMLLPAVLVISYQICYGVYQACQGK